MLTPSSMATLLALYDTFETPFPPAMTDATAAVRTARQLVEDVRHETEPAADLSSPKAVQTSLDKIALWRATHVPRVEVAGELAKRAVAAEAATFERCAGMFHRDLGQWFAETGEKLTALLESLGGETDMAANVARRQGDQHADLEAMAQRLTAIRAARSMLHGPLGSVSTPWQRWAQVLDLPSLGMANKIPNALSGGLKQQGPIDGTAAWWKAVLSVPGVTLHYRSPAEQAARYAELAPKPPVLAGA